MNLSLIGIGLLTLSGAFCYAQEAPKRVVDQGISVDFSASKPALQGDHPVSFRFNLMDTASGHPMGGLRPAAWLSQRAPGALVPICKEKVATYLGGDLFKRAEVDLNSYFVLTLNDDASISIVDPLFGFGGSKLLNMLQLESRGADWALAPRQATLFVSMPEVDKVAVIDTKQWEIVKSIATGRHPRRILTSERHAWVGDDQGISVIDFKTLAVLSVPFGVSSDLQASSDGELIFAGSGKSVVVLDAHSARLLEQVTVDGTPSLLAYSSAAKAIYALDPQQGRLFVIDSRNSKLTATVDIHPGATQIRFTPNGRYALIPNPKENIVQVLDAASNHIVQTVDISDGPDRISFSDRLAYILRRTSEIVLMISLEQLGISGKGLGVAEFPGGQHVFGAVHASLADSIISAPEGSAVLVANPDDKMIYLYNEGMAAPAGGFSTYGQTPQAVLVVDHGLREVQRGQYVTSVPVNKPGRYDVVMFVDAPRVVACFELTVAGDTNKPQRRFTRVTAVDPPKQLVVGAAARLRFALSDPDERGLQPTTDVRALTIEAPGVWQQRADLKRLPDGNYEFEFVPPESGTYYVWIESESLGLARNNSQFKTYQAN